ncbi:MAG: hypothetical protein ACJ8D6_03845 [Sphingomicrobium sp.]
MDRYKLLLLLLALTVVPLFYLSVWLGLAALVPMYALVARLASKDLDRRQLNKRNPLRHLRKR